MSSYVPPHLRNNTTMPRTDQQRNFRPRQSNQKTYWEKQREEEQKVRENEQKAIEEKRIQNLEMNDDNFPVLGNTSTRTSNWNGRKFSELAAEWKNEDDKLIESETMENNIDEMREDFVLPRFMTNRRFEETEDYVEENEVTKPSSPEDEWTTVSRRKVRKPKRIEDNDNYEFNPNDEVDENGDTVWDAPEEHETCWDEKR